jgi:GT2 family glycosyltransferase
MSASLAISVVICTRNRPDDLAACLASLAGQSRPADEIVVVDASDDDRSGVRVAAWHGPCPVVYRTASPGLTRQRNRGVELARGGVLTFLDDDVVLEPGYLAAIAACFAADPALGGAEGTIAHPGLRGRRRLGNALRGLLLMDNVGRRRVKRSGAVAYDPAPGAPRRVDCLSGCNMSFRRSVFARHRFDEWYDGYGLGEDLDFSYRVSREWPLVQTPAARLEHRQSPAGRERLPRLQEMSALNRYRFVRRHLPAGPLTWAAFAWGQVGELLSLLKAGDRAALGGRLRGYRRILAGHAR